PAAGVARRPAGRLHCLDVQSEPLQHPHDEGAACELIADRRVRLRYAGARVDRVAIALDDLGQALGAVLGLANLGQKLDATDVGDAVLALDPLPKGTAVTTERPGRLHAHLGAGDDGEGRHFGHKSRPKEKGVSMEPPFRPRLPSWPFWG